jgi:hypothetical protein
MVAMFEIAFVIVCVVLGLWWFSRTSTFRAHLRSGVDPDRRPRTDRERQEATGAPDASAWGFRMRRPSVRHHDDK